MNWMHYLLEANLYMAAFYALYLLLFRSETHYQLNRVYLLLTSLLSFVIPFIQLGILKPALQVTPTVSFNNADIGMGFVTTIPATTAVKTAAPSWTLDDYVLLTYVTVVSVLLFYLAIKIYRLKALSQKGSIRKTADFNLVELQQDSAAFSFFNYLFIDAKLASSQTIIQHEQVHIRQKHSWDIVYLEVIKAFNWFNPIVYLLQTSMKEVHEFIADQQTAPFENGADNYSAFLINNAYGITQTPLTNSFFNKNMLKRRIIMLYQKPSGKAARLKYLLAMPLACGLLCLSTMAFTNKNYGWIDLVPKPQNLSFESLVQNKKTGKVVISKASNSSLQVTVTNDQGETHTFYRDKITAIELVKWKNLEYSVFKAPNVPSNALPVNLANNNSFTDAGPLSNDTSQIYNKVEVNPAFAGGYAAFGAFLRDNIRYPKAAHDANVTGRVFVQFVVEKDGSLSDMKILRDPGSGLGEEAVRVLSLSPKWTPGMQNGQPVRVQFTVPVNFSLPPSDPVPAADGGKPIYNAVEVNPTFPGGEVGFSKFLTDNIKYPTAAKEAHVSGRIFIQMVVETDGSLTNMKVLRDPGAGLGDEGLRVLSLSPKWKPGMQNGQAVRVQFTVPINFSLAYNDPKNIDEFYSYVQKHVRYPTDAKNRNIQGRVFISFTLSPDKKAQDVVILRALDKSLGDEVARVLTSFNGYADWKANALYVLPVNFNINYGDNVKDSPKPIDPQPITNKYQSGPLERVSLNEVVVTTYPAVK